MEFKELQIGDLFIIKQGGNIYQKICEERYLDLFNTKVYHSSIPHLEGVMCNTDDDIEVSKIENSKGGI